MDTMLAMGPPGTDWVATGLPLASTLWTAAVVTLLEAWKFWMTPWLMKTRANTNVMGIMTPKQVRIVSTQKLPTVVRWRRVRPRMKAAASAMPTAEETKKWRPTMPTIWLRWLIVDSPT
jgi:hypothetical protein